MNTTNRERLVTKEVNTATTGTDQEVRVPVVEEELAVGKRTVETSGGVRVHQTVTERPVEESINLREEHVNVERRPVDRELRPGDLNNAFREQTIEMRESAEEAVIEKKARVVEEVVVEKGVSERTQHVADTVRRTDVKIEPIARTQTTGTEWSTVEPRYRTHFDTNFADAGMPYDTHYTHAYRYGHELAGEQRLTGKDWSAVEPDARSAWETHNKGSWDKFKDAVRYAFENKA